MTSRADLISRLEAATGPSRELDAMIHWHIKAGVGVGMAQDAPHYTDSIDAALALVPTTYSTAIHANEMEEYPTCWLVEKVEQELFSARVDYIPTYNVEPPPIGEGTSFLTPALALCIAALRAGEASSPPFRMR